MTNKEYEEQMERDVRTHWFPEHKATRHELRANLIVDVHEMQMIDWRKPSTGIFAVRYVIDRNILHVTGDIGHAIFRWSEGVSFDWLADCGLSYFAEKCEASVHGRRFQRWDSDVAATEINRIAKDMEQEGEENPLSGIPYECEIDCRSWLDRHWSDLRMDAERASSIMRAGMVLDPHCIGMWVGLKMIKEQQ